MTNVYLASASALTASTVTFMNASVAADNAATPFARSALAAVVGSLMSASLVEATVIAAFGSPSSVKTGKPIAKASGLRDLPGGARFYQAWKDVAYIIDNIDSDQPTDHVINDATVSIGTGAIRTAVVDFILEQNDGATALFGAKGITATVKALVAEYAKDVMRANGIDPEAKSEKTDADKSDAAPVSLTDMANAFLVAMRHASDDDMNAALEAIGAVADFIDARFAVVEPVAADEPAVVNG